MKDDSQGALQKTESADFLRIGRLRRIEAGLHRPFFPYRNALSLRKPIPFKVHRRCVPESDFIFVVGNIYSSGSTWREAERDLSLWILELAPQKGDVLFPAWVRSSYLRRTTPVVRESLRSLRPTGLGSLEDWIFFIRCKDLFLRGLNTGTEFWESMGDQNLPLFAVAQQICLEETKEFPQDRKDELLSVMTGLRPEDTEDSDFFWKFNFGFFG